MSATVHALSVQPLAKPVGAVSAALRILRCIGRHAESVRLSEIVREEALNPSTVFNILRTLEHEGLVIFDARSKRYALADGLVDLAAPVLDRRDAGRRVTRAMTAAAQELGATIGMWRRVGDEVELVRVERIERCDAHRLHHRAPAAEVPWCRWVGWSRLAPTGVRTRVGERVRRRSLGAGSGLRRMALSGRGSAQHRHRRRPWQRHRRRFCRCRPGRARRTTRPHHRGRAVRCRPIS